MPSFRAAHVHNEEKQRLAGDIQNVMALEVPLPSPPHNVPLAGFSPVRHWDGTGKGLSASILKIELRTASAIVIVAVDTLFLDEEFQVQLESRLSSNISLVLMASHTHFAPALARSVDALGGVDVGYYEAVLDCIANAIQSEVVSRLVAMGCFTTSTDLTINRRREGFIVDYGKLRRGQIDFRKGISMAEDPTGMVDPNLRCIAFSDSGGSPVACIWSLAAHAVFEDAYHAVSPEFPGRVRAFLKQRFGPDFVSIFMPGLAGSAIPRSSAKPFSQMTNKERLLRCLPFHHAIRPLDPAGYEDWASRLGDLIAEPLLSLDYRPITGMKAHYRRCRSQPIFWDRRREGMCLDLSVIRLGDEIEIVTSNGELLGEWKVVFDQVPVRCGMRIVSGYAAGACLYVPPSSEIRRGGYEVDRFRAAFGLDGEFVEAIDLQVITAFQQLLAET